MKIYSIKNVLLIFVFVSVTFNLVLFCPQYLQAKKLSESDVSKAVLTWVIYITADARINASIMSLEPYMIDGTIVAYIAHLENTGFCLCGSDDLVLPVYFYCPKGNYDPQNPNYEIILWEIAMRQKYLSDGIEKSDPEILQYSNVLEKRKAYWNDLISGNVKSNKNGSNGMKLEPDFLVLDFNSLWHQGSPYNDFCPELDPGLDNRTVVGCVATAMSQSMYYWQWPYTGQNSWSTDYIVRWRTNWDQEPLNFDPGIPAGWLGGGRLEWIPDNGGLLRMNGRWDGSVHRKAKTFNSDINYLNALNTLWGNMNIETNICTANFGNTYYDWSIMHHDHTDPPDIGDNEVAQLCYHAGVGVGMGYGLYGSGCGSWSIEVALENYFRYDPDVYIVNSDMNNITEDLQWLRIVNISGSGPPGGHAWTVYGYNKNTDPDRQFLMDLGWGGTDGWYTLDGIQFNTSQQTLLMIAPNNVKFVGNTTLGDGSPDNPFINIEYAVGQSPDHSTLIFKAGSTNNFAASTLVINKPITLKGNNVTITK